MSARHQPMLPSTDASGRGSAPQTSVRSPRNSSAFGRARFPALRSGTRHASRNQHWLSPSPCFPGRGYCGRNPAFRQSQLARSAQTGPNAGRTVSRAARDPNGNPLNPKYISRYNILSSTTIQHQWPRNTIGSNSWARPWDFARIAVPRILIPPCGGSNPPAPASQSRLYGPRPLH
jgi:hypothetical protein